MSYLSQAAEKVRDRAVGALPGFDPITILTIASILLPMILNCFKKQSPSTTPKEYLKDHFDENTQTFDSGLIESLRPRTRRAERKSGNTRKLSRDQLDEITKAALMQGMQEDESTVASCMVEAADIDTDD